MKKYNVCLILCLKRHRSALMVNEFKGTEHTDHCDGNQGKSCRHMITMTSMIYCPSIVMLFAGNAFMGLLNELPDSLPPASQQLVGIYLGNTSGQCDPIQGNLVLSRYCCCLGCCICMLTVDKMLSAALGSSREIDGRV